MTLRKHIFLVTLILIAVSCSIKDSLMSEICADDIEFSASRMRIVTKAGDEARTFSEGTDFRLFAIQSSSSWQNADMVKFYDLAGTGLSSGKVDYSIDGKKATYDVGENLDFYGLTYGNEDAVEVAGGAGSIPVVSVDTDADGLFPDLMYSDNLKYKNSSSGLLQMEFRHAFSRLTFEVLKQYEAEDEVNKQLEHVTLKGVVLKGSAVSAEFNLSTGEWTYDAATDVSDRTVYSNPDGLDIGSEAQVLKSGEKEIGLLVVPNSSEITLEVTLDLDGNTETDNDKTVSYALMSAEDEPLVLLPNHEYNLTITVLKNDVRVVTVTPRVYEWIDVDINMNDAYLGQPVYFGGMMWMDRNLGASSADCENDWYGTVGYYYHFGRNIPYILDVEAYLADSRKSFRFTGSASSTDPDAVFNMKFLFTYDNNGNKVTTVKNANNSSGSCLYGNAAITPGDPGDYSYIRGFVYESKGVKYLNNRSWAKRDLDFVNSNDSKVVEGMDNHIFWETIENQPCPVGWRLPGKADMYSFMPESTSLYWMDVYARGHDLTKNYDTNGDGTITKDDTNHSNYASGNKNAAGEIYAWKYFAGRLKVDPSADKTSDYSYPVSDTYARVYGIKYEGEDKVYRVMFEQKSSKGYVGRNFVRISRFASEPTDRFLVSSDGTQWNIHKFDWTNPVEYMDIPLAGFMYEDGMSDFGKGTILRAKEGDGNGTNWTLYLRADHNGVAVGGNSRRNLGENIRCVRNVNAK